MEPESWDAERLRANEELRRRQGTWSETTVAVAPDGSIAGMTEMSITDEGRGNCLQGGTLVLKAHRGHRLGPGAQGRATCGPADTRLPDLALIHSWNAEENDQMAAINIELGFRPVRTNIEFMRRL